MLQVPIIAGNSNKLSSHKGKTAAGFRGVRALISSPVSPHTLSSPLTILGHESPPWWLLAWLCWALHGALSGGRRLILLLQEDAHALQPWSWACLCCRRSWHDMKSLRTFKLRRGIDSEKQHFIYDQEPWSPPGLNELSRCKEKSHVDRVLHYF